MKKIKICIKPKLSKNKICIKPKIKPKLSKNKIKTCITIKAQPKQLEPNISIKPQPQLKMKKSRITFRSSFKQLTSSKSEALDHKTLSIDVGIINLSYCILASSKLGSNKYKILDWNIINLIDDQYEKQKCIGILKSGKKKGLACGNNASTFEPGRLDKCYCSIHSNCSKLNTNKLVPIRARLLCDKRLTSGKRKGQKCQKKASWYHENPNLARDGYCTVHAKKMTGLTRYYTVDNISDFDLKIKLFTELDKHQEDFLDVDTVLIEFQPPFAREKMKMVSSALHDYFILRSQVGVGISIDSRIKIIKSVDAVNKLTVYDGPAISCNLKKQYDRNKWYGKQYCRWILNKSGFQDKIMFFDNFKKKDDLADSFLQGIWYIWYGQYGKKPSYNVEHQKTVFKEQNWNKFKKIRAVKPNKKQIAKKRITLSNIKYLWKNNRSMDPYSSSIEFYFGEVTSFQNLLKSYRS